MTTLSEYLSIRKQVNNHPKNSKEFINLIRKLFTNDWNIDGRLSTINYNPYGNSRNVIKNTSLTFTNESSMKSQEKTKFLITLQVENDNNHYTILLITPQNTLDLLLKSEVLCYIRIYNLKVGVENFSDPDIDQSQLNFLFFSYEKTYIEVLNTEVNCFYNSLIDDSISNPQLKNGNLYKESYNIDEFEEKNESIVQNLQLDNRKDSNKPIHEVISEYDITNKDFSLYLKQRLTRAFYSLSSIQSICNKRDIVSIIGVITSIKTEEKINIIELTSLKDSNILKVYSYKKLNLDGLCIGKVIEINNIQLKINKNLDVVLENPSEYHIKVIGQLNSLEMTRIKRFRFDSSSSFDTILSLCKPLLNRSINKLCFVIKKIISIQAVKDDHLSIINYPNISLLAKLIIDDGTFEALMWVYNMKVIELFKLSNTTLDSINNSVLTSHNVVLFDLFSNKGVLLKESFDFIYVTKLIGYCIPYSNVTKKTVLDTNYSHLFKNLSNNEDNMKNKAGSMVFINGDITAENFSISNEYYVQPRPMLKLINYELLDC